MTIHKQNNAYFQAWLIGMKCIINACFLLFLMSISINVFGQKRIQLESRRSELIEKISYTNKLIKENSAKEATTTTDLYAIEKQIDQRNELIELLSKQQSSITKKSEIIRDSIDMIEQNIQSTKEKYSILLRKAHLRQLSTHPYQFFLSSSSIYEGFKNLIYMKQMDKYVQTQYKNRLQLKLLLSEKRQSLETTSTALSTSLKEHESQKYEMNKNMKEKAKLLARLKQNESKLKAKLTKQKKDRESLNKKIEDIILNELRNEKALNKNLPASPEMAKLSINFVGNKGKLPWPTKKGIIVSTYGKHRHKTLKLVTVNNNGIDIQTESGADVYALFDGEVVGIANIPGFDKMVVIKHGSYYTVYSKMKTVVVQKGQKVQLASKLGNVTTTGEHKGIVHLEIWNKKTKLNPERWISHR